MGLRRSSATALLVSGIVALPSSAAAAPGVLSSTTYPTRAVAVAAGQFAWLSIAGGQVTVERAPVSGGPARVLGSVPGPPAGTGPLADTTPAIAFDGTQYAATVLMRYSLFHGANASYALITGTVSGAPRVVVSCHVAGGHSAGGVALAGGQAYVASAPCGAPRGLDVVAPAGPPTAVDPAGRAPIAGAGTWLAYTKPGASQISNLAGAGSYLVAALGRQTSPLVVNANGQALIAGDVVAPATPLRTPIPALPTGDAVAVAQLLTADRWVYTIDPNSTTSAESPFTDTRIGVQPLAGGPAQTAGTAGRSDPVALALDGNQLTELSSSCTGTVVVEVIDLTKVRSGGVAGCPVKFTKRPLLLSGRRLAVGITCPNGCRGDYELEDDSDQAVGKPAKLNLRPGKAATLHFTLTKSQAAGLAEVNPRTTSPWLYTGRFDYSSELRRVHR